MKVALKGVVGLFAVVVITAGVLSLRVLGLVVGAPGGALAGTVQAYPTDWLKTNTISTIQLETAPADPYSVNLWGVGVGNRFYVGTRPEGTGWSQRVEADPRVVLRVGENLYPLLAARVTEASERDRVIDAYVAKYEAEREAMATQAGVLYRLGPRTN